MPRKPTIRPRPADAPNQRREERSPDVPTFIAPHAIRTNLISFSSGVGTSAQAAIAPATSPPYTLRLHRVRTSRELAGAKTLLEVYLGPTSTPANMFAATALPVDIISVPERGSGFSSTWSMDEAPSTDHTNLRRVFVRFRTAPAVATAVSLNYSLDRRAHPRRLSNSSYVHSSYVARKVLDATNKGTTVFEVATPPTGKRIRLIQLRAFQETPDGTRQLEVYFGNPNSIPASIPSITDLTDPGLITIPNGGVGATRRYQLNQAPQPRVNYPLYARFHTAPTSTASYLIFVECTFTH